MVTIRVTDSDDVDAVSASSPRFIPRQRRIVRVPVCHDHQVVGYVRSVSVSRLEHHVCREPAKDNEVQIITQQLNLYSTNANATYVLLIIVSY